MWASVNVLGATGKRFLFFSKERFRGDRVTYSSYLFVDLCCVWLIIFYLYVY